MGGSGCEICWYGAYCPGDDLSHPCPNGYGCYNQSIISPDGFNARSIFSLFLTMLAAFECKEGTMSISGNSLCGPCQVPSRNYCATRSDDIGTPCPAGN